MNCVTEVNEKGRFGHAEAYVFPNNQGSMNGHSNIYVFCANQGSTTSDPNQYRDIRGNIMHAYIMDKMSPEWKFA